MKMPFSTGRFFGPVDFVSTRQRLRLVCCTVSGLMLFPLCRADTSSPMEPTPLIWTPLPALPDPEGFASAFAGVSHDALLVAGGANFPGKRPWEGGTKVWYDRIFVLTDERAAWRIAGRLPRPNAYGISCSVAGGVVCIGGGDASAHSREVFLLVWNGREAVCQPLPALPVPLAFGSGATLDGVIYVFGGLTRPDATSAEATLFRLDPAAPTPTWETLAPCPGAPRMLAQMGAANGEIVICGGVAVHAGPDGKAARSYLRDSWAFSPKNGWRQLADMPHAVAAAPSPMPLTSSGELLVISGDDGSRGHLIGPHHPGFLQEVLAYDPVRNLWRKLPDGPLSRATAPTAWWSGAWIVASGERKPGYRSPEIWSVRSAP